MFLRGHKLRSIALASSYRRKRRSVLVAAVGLLLLLGSVGYAAWRQQQALEEGRRALQMQTFLYRLFKLANSNYTGKPAATVPEFLALGVRMLPNYIKNPADLRQAQLALAESMFDNGDYDSAAPVFTKIAAEAKSAGDIAAETEADAFAGNIAYSQGEMEQGAALTANALELSRSHAVPPSRPRLERDFLRLESRQQRLPVRRKPAAAQHAVQEARSSELPPRETADALYNLASDLELRGLFTGSRSGV